MNIMNKPDGKVNAGKGQTFDTNSKILPCLILVKFVIEHP